MRILAIDPGLRCGWALGHAPKVAASGTWELSPPSLRRVEGVGMRWIRLRRLLSEIAAETRPDLVAFEEVRGHKGTTAAHVYGGAVATIQAWCEQHEIPYTAIPVATVKRRATGIGNAGKAAVLEAARREWPEQAVEDDNQADALWLMQCAWDEVEEVSFPRGTIRRIVSQTRAMSRVLDEATIRAIQGSSVDRNENGESE